MMVRANGYLRQNIWRKKKHNHGNVSRCSVMAHTHSHSRWIVDNKLHINIYHSTRIKHIKCPSESIVEVPVKLVAVWNMLYLVWTCCFGWVKILENATRQGRPCFNSLHCLSHRIDAVRNVSINRWTKHLNLTYILHVNALTFQLAGLCILAVGVWAWNEKDMFSNLSKSTNVALDPAFILICIGTVTFIIGFTGCVGALRENTCLLAMVSALVAAYTLKGTIFTTKWFHLNFPVCRISGYDFSRWA